MSLLIHLVYGDVNAIRNGARLTESSLSLHFPGIFRAWWHTKLHSVSKVYWTPSHYSVAITSNDNDMESKNLVYYQFKL